MAHLNHCRLCLKLVKDPVTAANIYTKLSDGTSLAEHLDTLFDVLVGDYSDGDALKLLCSECVAQITKCASGKASVQQMETIGQRFRSMEGNARMFIRGQSLQIGSSPNSSINSPFGMSTPKVATVHPVSASTGQKRTARDADLDWLLSQQPSTSGTRRPQKKVIVREIHLDEEDDERETVVKTKCPFCQMTYIRHTALLKHIESIHPEKEIKYKSCEWCSRKFLNAAELKAHKCAKKRSSGGGWWGWRRRGWW
ncbi:uncharacterized protein LOC5571050 isoform X1 [Aedes aegypti]|uniref:ZAD domain-containing protein n=1 Tax=Aedes aegypti TaxID=7159 RepID=A0A6I8TX50_AEDAE|nr:uncharacterized protein LOC5571050 isoform X1 [Aedes aegypti]XP_021699371.1 uncharacterized protein LOC5571050 isoform X1 [Aedes aegypti]